MPLWRLPRQIRPRLWRPARVPVGGGAHLTLPGKTCAGVLARIPACGLFAGSVPACCALHAVPAPVFLLPAHWCGRLRLFLRPAEHAVPFLQYGPRFRAECGAGPTCGPRNRAHPRGCKNHPTATNPQREKPDIAPAEVVPASWRHLCHRAQRQYMPALCLVLAVR